MVKYVTYSNKESVIIQSGVAAIEKVLLGTDVAEKESLLFCLDRYMDPWFGYDLSYVSDIELLLQRVIVETNPISVKEEAINLLSSYSYPPFILLEEKIDQVEDELKEEIRYLLNMDKEM